MTFRYSSALALMHRPQLITPNAAFSIAQRIREIEPHAFERQSRLDALLRTVGLKGNAARKPRADFEDEHGATPVAIPTRPDVYAPAWLGEPDDELEWGASVKDGIALLEIRGPLAERGEFFCGEWFHGYDTIAAAIAEADGNRHVKAILVRFDTPGGVVASGIYDLAATLQARGPDAKPLWAHCEMACSAGYWIASQFGNVLAPKAGLIGSIGAVMTHESYAGAMERAGIVVESIQFGAQKTDGAYWKALSEEARADLQAMIDEIGRAFCDTVAIGRSGKLSADQARATEARVFSADNSDKSRSALALGLIDGVMSEQQAFEAIKAQVAEPAVITIPAPAGPTAASAATSTKENDVKLRAAIKSKFKAGKAAAKTDSEILEEIRQLVNAPAEDAPAGEDEPAAAEDDEDEAEAATGDDADEDEDEDEDEAEATATTRPAAAAKPAMVDASIAQAILALPEAKGREALAQRLAFKPGITVEDAKADLAAAPRGKGRLAGVTPINVSASVDEDTRSEGRKVADRALALAGIKTTA